MDIYLELLIGNFHFFGTLRIFSWMVSQKFLTVPFFGTLRIFFLDGWSEISYSSFFFGTLRNFPWMVGQIFFTVPFFLEL